MPRKSSPSIKARVLGDASIVTANSTIEPHAEILFAAALYFVFERKKSVSRRTLQSVLWPSESSTVSAHRLRQTVLKLKQMGVPIEVDGKEYLTLNGTPVSVDYEEFLATRNGIDDEDVDALVMLPAYEPRFSERYLEWLDARKADVNASLTRVMLAIIAQHRVKGEWVEVEKNATKLLRFQPFNEEATLALAEAHAMRGEKLQATAILDRYLAEVGTGPSDLRLPATVMRRRIADRLHPRVESNLGQSPLVGRSSEMELLANLLNEIRSGKGQTCLIWGDAGVGKSRLLADFSTFASLQGVTTQRIHCRPSDQQQPLSVFVDLVPPLRAMRGSLGCAPETLKYLDTLTRPASTASNGADGNSDSEFIYSKIEAALFDLMDAVSDEGCLIILVEDIHWLDAVSAKLLREMIAWNVNHPILFAFTGRDAPQSWLNVVTTTILRLEPLRPEPSRDIFLAVARQHGREVGSKYLDWCVSVAEGNPYFLQELANQWIEKGDERIAPKSLTAVLNDRVSRLSEDALLVLQTCALLEGESTFDHVGKTIDFPSHQMLRAINELASAGMLIVETDPSSNGGNRLSSRHDLLSNASLASLTPPARAFLHRRIGTVFESEIESQHSAALMWESAKHWQRAGDKKRALTLAKLCASHLMNLGLATAAAEAYENALLYSVTASDRLDTLRDLAFAYHSCTDFIGVRQTVQKARMLQRKLWPTSPQHDELELMGIRAEWQLAVPSTVISQAMTCLRTLTASPSHRIEAGTLGLMMIDSSCQHGPMHDAYKLIEEISAQHSITSPSLFEARMVYHLVTGSPTLAVEAAHQLLELERKTANSGLLCRRLCNASVVFRGAGLHEEATRLLLESEQLADDHRLPSAMLRTLSMLGHVALEQGSIDTARRTYDKGVKMTAGAQAPLPHRDIGNLGARLALIEGDVDLARRRFGRKYTDIIKLPMGTGRSYDLAVHMAIQLAKGSVRVREVEELEVACSFSRTSLRQAFECLILCSALRVSGRRDDGDRLLRDYITNLRRETWPIPEAVLSEAKNLENFGTYSRDRR